MGPRVPRRKPDPGRPAQGQREAQPLPSIKGHWSLIQPSQQRGHPGNPIRSPELSSIWNRGRKEAIPTVPARPCHWAAQKLGLPAVTLAVCCPSCRSPLSHDSTTSDVHAASAIRGSPFPMAHCCHDCCHHCRHHRRAQVPARLPPLGVRPILEKAAILGRGRTLQDPVCPGLETGPWPAGNGAYTGRPGHTELMWRCEL